MIELPSLSVATVILLLTLAAGFVLIQPVLFGASATAMGEKRPGYLASVAALILAGLTTTVVGLFYSFTFGVFLSRFGQVPVMLGGLGVSWLTSGFVYSGFLRVPWSRGVQVAAVYWLASGLLTAVIGVVLKLVL